MITFSIQHYIKLIVLQSIRLKSMDRFEYNTLKLIIIVLIDLNVSVGLKLIWNAR